MGNEKEKKGKIVKAKERVTVYATDKAKYVEAGTKMVVTPTLAEKLLTKGKATKDAPKVIPTP